MKLPLLLMGLSLTVPAAQAANPFPDWMAQAAAAKVPSYPPNTDAVVLLDDRLITVAPDGRATERQRRVVKILKPQGRQYAEIVAAYTKDEKLDHFHAWSIARDGHQYTVKDQEVHDEALGEWGILYDDLRVVEAGWQDSDLINVVAAVDSNGFPVSSVPSSLAGCRVLLLIC